MRNLACILLIFVFGPVFAGPASKKDSLINLLKVERTDTGKAKLLAELSYTLVFVNPDSGVKVGIAGLQLSQKANWPKGIALNSHSIGQNYFVRTEFALALKYTRIALDINRREGFRAEMARNLSNIGSVYTMIDSPAIALPYLVEGLQINHEIGDKKREANSLANIGIFYGNLNDYTHALDYYFRSLKIAEAIDDKIQLASNYTNIGIVYKNQGNYQKARENYRRALRIYAELHNQNGESAAYSNLGSVYFIEDSLAEAAIYFNRALKIAEEIGAKKYMAINIANIADVMRAQGNYMEAIARYKEALVVNKANGYRKSEGANYAGLGNCYLARGKQLRSRQDISAALKYLAIADTVLLGKGELKERKITWELIAEARQAIGDVGGAFVAYKKAVLLADSLSKLNNKVQVARLETQREIEIRERDIKIQNNKIELARLEKANKNKERIIYISGIVLLLGAIAYGSSRLIKQQRHNRKLAREKKKHLEKIEAQATVLQDIAYIQSHEVRGPVSTLLGLASLYNFDDPADPSNRELIEGIISVTQRLDTVVTDVVARENNLNK